MSPEETKLVTIETSLRKDYARIQDDLVDIIERIREFNGELTELTVAAAAYSDDMSAQGKWLSAGAREDFVDWVETVEDLHLDGPMGLDDDVDDVLPLSPRQ